MADLKQWVNLPRDAKWVTHITGADAPSNVERVGPIHLKVKFKNDKPANFKIQVALKNGASYVRKEQARNVNFKLRNGLGSAFNQNQKEIAVPRDISLPAAGGNEYSVKAKYKEKEVEGAKTVETRRGLFYYSVKQDSTGAPNGTCKGGNVDGQIADPGAILTRLENEHWDPGDNYYIRLVNKGGGTSTVAFTDTLGKEYAPDPATPGAERVVDATQVWRNQSEQFSGGAFSPLGAGQAKGTGATRTDPSNPAVWLGVFRHGGEWGMLDAVKGAIPRGDAQALKPYCFVVVWCNYIADKSKKIITYAGAAGVAASKLVLNNGASEVYISTGGPWLWHGFNQANDNAKSWLVDCKVTFIDAAGVRTDVTVDRARLQPYHTPQGDFGGFNWIKMDLSDPADAAVKDGIFNGTRGTYEISLTIYVVKGMSCGYAMPGLNIVVVCDKANYVKMTDAEKIGIIAHELGHAIGMTAQGGKPTTETFNGVSATTPNFPASLYGNIQNGPNENSCQHQGNHCNNGASWSRGAWDATATNSGGGLGRYKGTWSGRPQCVMFGAIGVWDTATNASITNPSTYCGNCKPIVRKLDLGGNLFASCVTD